ncbi:galactosyltransferase-domain-containing protein [Paraphysoderma sedebokerense]|nr:galactosyltransferase-domain-containing protein [Paraphysoderma sedebokerense]
MRQQNLSLAILSRPSKILLLVSVTISLLFLNAGYLYRLYPESSSAARPQSNSNGAPSFHDTDSGNRCHCDLNNNSEKPPNRNTEINSQEPHAAQDTIIPPKYYSFGNKIILDSLKESKRGEQTELVLAVLTYDSEKEEAFRNAVRETWISDQNWKEHRGIADEHTNITTTTQSQNAFNPNTTLRLFFVGTQNMTADRLRDLKQEQLLHRDIIFLPNHQDTYADLTSKMAQIHHFLMHIQPTYFPNLKWLFKTDTDVFLSLPSLYNLTYQHEPQKIILGLKFYNAAVLRSGKWKSDYQSDRYPVYVAGAGYLMSYDISRWIGVNYDNGWLKMHSNEDAALGIWVTGLDVTMLHSDGVITGAGLFTSAEDLCTKNGAKLDPRSVFLIHHLTLQGLKSVGEKWRKDGKFC